MTPSCALYRSSQIYKYPLLIFSSIICVASARHSPRFLQLHGPCARTLRGAPLSAETQSHDQGMRGDMTGDTVLRISETEDTDLETVFEQMCTLFPPIQKWEKERLLSHFQINLLYLIHQNVSSTFKIAQNNSLSISIATNPLHDLIILLLSLSLLVFCLLSELFLEEPQ